MLSLHHTHLFASDVDRSIAFWRDHFGAVVVLDALAARLKAAGASVTDVRRHAEADYAMAQGPDGVLLELFQPHAERVPAALAEAGYFATRRGGKGGSGSV